MNKLAYLDRETSDCARCGLAFGRAANNTVTAFGQGSAEAKYLLITSIPAYGLETDTEAQKILKKIWTVNRIDKNEWFVTHAIMCPSSYHEVKFAEIDACRDRLIRTISILNPYLIVVSSAMAAYALMGQRGLELFTTYHPGPTYSSASPGNMNSDIIPKIINGGEFEGLGNNGPGIAGVVDIEQYLSYKEMNQEDAPELVSQAASKLMDSWSLIYRFLEHREKIKTEWDS